MILTRELVNLGLSEKEAKVYVASLELGPSSVQKISEKANVNRATTYTNIDVLIEFGLMNSYKQEKKVFFYAEPPEKIVYILIKKQERELEEKEKNIKKIVPKLQAMQAEGDGIPKVRYFEGREGMKALVREVFQTGSSKEIRFIYPREKLFNFFTQEELIELGSERRSKKIKSRSIVASSEAPKEDEDTLYKVLKPEDFDIECDVAFYDDQVRIISLKDSLTGIIIKDKNIAESFKNMFDVIWDELKVEKGKFK